MVFIERCVLWGEFAKPKTNYIVAGTGSVVFFLQLHIIRTYVPITTTSNPSRGTGTIVVPTSLRIGTPPESTFNSDTFPCMSYKPKPVGSLLATYCVELAFLQTPPFWVHFDGSKKPLRKSAPDSLARRCAIRNPQRHHRHYIVK